jgi:hypothetical protein
MVMLLMTVPDCAPPRSWQQPMSAPTALALSAQSPLAGLYKQSLADDDKRWAEQALDALEQLTTPRLGLRYLPPCELRSGVSVCVVCLGGGWAQGAVLCSHLLT